MLEYLCMLCHIFHLPSYCVSMLVHILLIRGHPLVVLIVWFYFFCQMDGQECLRTSSSYLCFLSSQTLFMLHHKFWSSQIWTRWVRSTRSHRFIIDLNFQNLSMYLGLTDSFLSVKPSSLSWSRFSISVQTIWTFRSHRFAVTEHSYASRCHRVVPLGHTDRVELYI